MFILSCNLPRVVGWPTLAMRGGLTQTKSVGLEQHTCRRRVIINDTTCTANNFYGNDMNKSENSTFMNFLSVFLQESSLPRGSHCSLNGSSAFSSRFTVLFSGTKFSQSTGKLFCSSNRNPSVCVFLIRC